MGRNTFLFILLAATCSGCTSHPWQGKRAEQAAPRSLTAEVLDWEVERNLAAAKLAEAELALASYAGQPVSLTAYQATARGPDRMAPVTNAQFPPTPGYEVDRSVAHRSDYSAASQQQRQRAVQVAGLLTQLVSEDNPAVPAPRRDTPVAARQGSAAATPLATTNASPPSHDDNPSATPDQAELAEMRQQLHGLLQRLDRMGEPKSAWPAQPSPTRPATSSVAGDPVQPARGPQQVELADLQQTLVQLASQLERQMQPSDAASFAESLGSEPNHATAISVSIPDPQQTIRPSGRANFPRLPRIADLPDDAN